MSENCCCEKEKKEFCVIYTMGEKESHVVIIAKSEQDAIQQFYNTAQLINRIFGLDVEFIVNCVYQEC